MNQNRYKILTATALFLLFAGCGDSSTSPNTSSSLSSSSADSTQSSSSSSSGTTPLSSSAIVSSGTSSSSNNSSSSENTSSSSSLVISSGTSSSSSSAPSSSSSGTTSSSNTTSSSFNPFNPRVSYGEYTDTRNNKVYKTVLLGNNLEFFAQNLDLGTQINGSEEQDDDGTLEKYCYNDDPANCEIYGGLYQWSEAMDFPYACNSVLTSDASCSGSIVIPTGGEDAIEHQGICPSGWHIMNRNNWSTVFDGDIDQDADRLKSRAMWGGSNTTGFSALPAGSRLASGSFIDGGTITYFWKPGEYSSRNGYSSQISGTPNILQSFWTKAEGLSIRCVKD